MKCALCNHKGSFAKTGSKGSRKIYRCPVCKYDQTKSVFGEGQFISGRDPVPVFEVPVEASWKKLMFYARMKQGVGKAMMAEAHPREHFPVPRTQQEMSDLLRDDMVRLGLDEAGASLMFDNPPESVQVQIAGMMESFQDPDDRERDT